MSSACGPQLIRERPTQEEIRKPPCTKRVTAELGCVTPYIIVPGQWTQSDMEYYASEIVAGLVNNNAHNCTKAEIIVTDAAWPQREAFLAVFRCCSAWLSLY